jgi:hypothetical protein
VKNDLAVSNPTWKSDGHGVLLHKNGQDRIKRVGSIWRSMSKTAKVETNNTVPILVPQTLPHLYIEE